MRNERESSPRSDFAMESDAIARIPRFIGYLRGYGGGIDIDTV
jgi:hypothetical protein